MSQQRPRSTQNSLAAGGANGNGNNGFNPPTGPSADRNWNANFGRSRGGGFALRGRVWGSSSNGRQYPAGNSGGSQPSWVQNTAGHGGDSRRRGNASNTSQGKKQLKYAPERYRPNRFYVDQADIPPGVGDAAAYSHCPRCHELKGTGHLFWQECTNWCAIHKDDSHRGEMCDLLYATESYYKRTMKRAPLDPNIKIRPSVEDCQLLLGLGHNWAAGLQPVQQQRLEGQAHAPKRTAEQAELEDANSERAKRVALEHQVKYGKQMVESLREEIQRLRRDLDAAHAKIATSRAGQSATTVPDLDKQSHAATQPGSLSSQPLDSAAKASGSRLDNIFANMGAHS